MSVEILVPQMGESVTEGTIARWLKRVGDAVQNDDLLVEIETDKVTMEIRASTSGVLTDVLVEAGQTVSIGTVLGKIDANAKQSPNVSVPVSAPTLSSPVSVPVLGGVSKDTPAEIITSPSARKIIEEKKIDPATVSGTGKDGRIIKEDVLSHSPSVTPVAQQHVVTQPQETRVKMTKLRQTIARRLKDAQNTAAILTTFNEIDMSSVMTLRNDMKDVFEKRHGVKLGFMGFFVKAVVQALRDIPAVNAEIQGEDIVFKDYYHIGVAVGTEKGLVVPVLRNCQDMNFADIEKQIAEYGKAARDGRLAISDLQGGTFTISNGGVYGSLMSTPIINPPQSGILGMHKIQDRPVAIKGQVVIRPMMYLALSYDHRIIDGKEAVTFLVRVKELLEDPRRLLLDV